MSDKGFRLNSILTYKSAFSLTKWLAVTAVIGAFATVVYVVERFTGKIYVTDRTGYVTEAELIDREQVRSWEYEFMVKYAFKLIYSNNYRSFVGTEEELGNFEKSLDYFLDITQEYLIEHVQRNRISDKLKDSKGTTFCSFKTLSINTKTIPVRGNLEIIQTISAPGVEDRQILISTPFIIVNAPVTKDNLYGAAITGLDLKYSLFEND